ncbi:MAG: Ca2+/Na+ antiporter [Pseudoalteromonas distincta]|jgi:Ca2+/Na+ antiporter
MIGRTEPMLTQRSNHTAARRRPATAGRGPADKLFTQRAELGDLCVHSGQLLLGDGIGAIAYPFGMIRQFEQIADRLHREAKLPRMFDAPQPAHIPLVVDQAVAMGAFTAVAAAVILASVEPFAEAMVDSGGKLGLDEFLLIQWLAPFASEAPAVTIAVLLVLSGRAGAGLATMISDKINQWTLLVGMLPLAMGFGAGALTALPLDARQHEEFFLTAAQSLLGIAVLLRLRLTVFSAAVLALLFVLQVMLAVYFLGDQTPTVASLTVLAWAYLGLAGLVMAMNAWRLRHLLLLAFFTRHPETLDAAGAQVPTPTEGSRRGPDTSPDPIV